MADNKKMFKKKSKIKPLILLFLLAFTAPLLGYFSFFNGIQKIFSKNFLLDYKTYNVSIDQGVAQDISDEIEKSLLEVEYNGEKRFQFVDENPDISIVWKEGEGLINKYYVPVAHYYSVEDNFDSSKQNIYIFKNTSVNILDILKSKYPKIKTVEDIDKVLDEKTKNVALIDINDLDYTYKLLNFSKKYFLDDISAGVVVSLSVDCEDEFAKNVAIKNISKEISNGNFDSQKVGKINQTGVVAITRELAKRVDLSGNWGYPALKIADFLKDADITHVSNEVSFVPGCTPSSGMRFCSRPEYIKALEISGVDIVELTGNHNNDYGSSYNESSIDLYNKKGMQYFGGGKDEKDASKILYLDIKGSKVAFLGYNYYDTMLGTGAIASSDRAGANSYSESKMKKDIAKAKENAGVVIVDFQFQECYAYPETLNVIYPPCYKPMSSPDQKGVFRLAIDYGADIVVGTQAHQPQTYEIYKGKLIFYGLGNLFFDQARWPGTRQGLVLSHYTYNGKVIQTKITTTYYDLDLQTYVTKGDERKFLLNLLKEAR